MTWTTKNLLGRRRSAFVVGLSLVMLSAAPLSASNMEIQFTGLDIEYDGTDIFTTSSPDSLAAATIFFDGSELTTLTSGLSLDLFIPGVSGLSATPGSTTSVVSSGGGIFELELGGGDHLDLGLDPVSITYVDVSGLLQFALGAGSSSIVSQLLPDGLILSDPVSVSFSANVDPDSVVVGDEDALEGFLASGTGEVEGEAELDPNEIPEPQSLALGIFALLCIGCSSRRLENGS